jgi:purine-nucleoside phosphorylase
MIYIVVALKGEAQAFVDKYKLCKKNVHGFTLFQNTNMCLIISGMGVQNARVATQTLINLYDINDEDIYLNVGICGADKAYKIGELLAINAVSYQEQFYKLKHEDGFTLICVDEELSHAAHELADMESFGFYDAVIHSPAIKNFYIFKVVSDHFEPQTVSKNGAKMLLFKRLDEINAAIHS